MGELRVFRSDCSECIHRDICCNKDVYKKACDELEHLASTGLFGGMDVGLKVTCNHFITKADFVSFRRGV